MIPRSLVEKRGVGESSQFLEADTRFNFFFHLQPYLGCQTVTDSRLRQSHVALCSDPGAVSQSPCHVMGLSSSLRKSQDACGPPPVPGPSLKSSPGSLLTVSCSFSCIQARAEDFPLATDGGTFKTHGLFLAQSICLGLESMPRPHPMVFT